VSIYKSSDPPPPALGHFLVPDLPPSLSSCPPPPPPLSSSPTATFCGATRPMTHRILRLRRPTKIRRPPTRRRRRPPKRGRLPPRPASAFGAPHPHTPRVGLLPILLLCAVLPGLRGSAVATRRAPCRPVGLSVVTSASASTSSPRPSCRGASRLSSPTPVGARPPSPPQPPAYIDPAWVPRNWVLLMQAN
jgi:hypothetical protein